ncbi:hypothetical protein [Massilia scottii]|uniref:hypothetical protein n=1 Tax=Massilia scottii TaxID=3057166 RepID=UPI002796B94D|nr:hypothetical protein [Massilia sp. CCM 9029]MDQ1833140.1 hypothetical protein [Massilia sp. CCM 9029]
MSKEINVGDSVRLLGVPDWLIHDLPESEQVEILSFVGQVTVVTEIDAYGYFWVGFGETLFEGSVAHYSGHSFCVSREWLTLTNADDQEAEKARDKV